MVNPQLLQYVRAQRAAGVSKEDIIKALGGGGWSATDAQEAFAVIEAPPPPAAPRPAPLPPVTPAPVQQRPTPIAAPQPAAMTVRPQSAAVIQPRPSYAPQPRRRSRWPWVLLFLIIFFVLGMGAGAYVAVTNEWFNSLVAGIAGVEPMQDAAESMLQVANEGDMGGFLEVSTDPFDTTPSGEENSTSTSATTTATTTSTTGAE